MKREEVCFQPADVMLPCGLDMHKWSVVACDQYTSEPEYWAETEKIVGEAPSTLRMILPEVYLEQDGIDERIEKINRTMEEYSSAGYFRTLPKTFVLVKRVMPSGKTRFGIIGMVDLEQYDYNAGAGSMIRATEGTVLTRLPPRVKVRRGATLELPHIMLLIDDPDKTVIEPAADMIDSFKKEYDFELMQGGGHITGYSVTPKAAGAILDALCDLGDEENFRSRYEVDSRDVLLFASGDGNHSLATAKKCWEEEKAKLPKEEWTDNPKRYALVELVNLHDSSLEFEAIHRVVFDIDPDELMKALFEFYPAAHLGTGSGHSFEFVSAGKSGMITLEGMTDGVAVGALQDFLDFYIKENGGKIDYIHGEDVTKKLGSRPGSIGFILPVMKKSELFRAVITRGVLPRKTFSMGEAHEKRYYLEGRSLV